MMPTLLLLYEYFVQQRCKAHILRYHCEKDRRLIIYSKFKQIWRFHGLIDSAHLTCVVVVSDENDYALLVFLIGLHCV